MSKKVKFIAHLKISCNYDGDIEYENDEELLEKVTQIVNQGTLVKSVETARELDEEEKENVWL